MISTGNPGVDLSQEVINDFARASLEAARKYFLIPENQAKFEKWQKENASNVGRSDERKRQ